MADSRNKTWLHEDKDRHMQALFILVGAVLAGVSTIYGMPIGLKAIAAGKDKGCLALTGGVISSVIMLMGAGILFLAAVAHSLYTSDPQGFTGTQDPGIGLVILGIMIYLPGLGLSKLIAKDKDS
jgi:hypothetical protein